MKIANYGRIINIISTSVKQPIKGLGVSNTIRGAVASWAKTLSFELGEFGITVNNILPGFIDSLPEKEEFKSRIPLKRYGKTNEISEVVSFLASDGAAYITGQNIRVDGGITKSV